MRRLTSKEGRRRDDGQSENGKLDVEKWRREGERVEGLLVVGGGGGCSGRRSSQQQLDSRSN
jgi:hypothetical protein